MHAICSPECSGQRFDPRGRRIPGTNETCRSTHNMWKKSQRKVEHLFSVLNKNYNIFVLNTFGCGDDYDDLALQYRHGYPLQVGKISFTAESKSNPHIATQVYVLHKRKSTSSIKTHTDTYNMHHIRYHNLET